LKIQGPIPGNIPGAKTATAPPSGGLIRGELARTGDGKELVLKTQGQQWPVQLLMADLPCNQEMTFQIIGRENGQLLLRVVNPGEDRLAGTLQNLGFKPTEFWRELAQGLLLENMAVSRENLVQLERFLRLARQQWGVVLNPRVVAHLMSRGLPVTPETVLFTIYQLFPGYRKDFPGKPRTLPVDPEDVEGLAEFFREFQETGPEGTERNLAMLISPVVWQTKDGGEIHWPVEQGGNRQAQSTAGFVLELIPPNLGLVEVKGFWEEQCCNLTFIVAPEVIDLFRIELPNWLTRLEAAGFHIYVTVKARETGTSPPVSVDGWV